MNNIIVCQTDICEKWIKKAKRSATGRAVLKSIQCCFSCSSSKPNKEDCRFYSMSIPSTYNIDVYLYNHTEEDGSSIEQRTFLVSPKPHKLLEVRPYMHSAHVAPIFKPPPTTLTVEMIAECLVCCHWHILRNALIGADCQRVYPSPSA